MLIKMDTSSPFEESFIEDLEVSSTTSSSIHLGWQIRSSSFPFIEGYRVHYQQVASTYVQYGPKLAPSDVEYDIRNLVADTYYKVCLVVYRNYTSPFRECVDASTTNWQLPVSIGSSIGAVLALSMIVFIVLLSRCQIPMQYKRKRRTNSSRYDTMSSNYHDEHYDFSETATHGNEDDFASEFDHDEEGFCEISSHSQTKPNHAEKVSIPNGLCKNHVHPHVYLHNQQRNSLGRVHCPSSHSSHHHTRPIRSFSITTPEAHSAYINQHFHNIRKDPHKMTTTRESPELFMHSLSPKQADKSKRALHVHREPYSKKDLLKHDPDVKQRPPLLFQHSTQGFSYIDESQDGSVKSDNQNKDDVSSTMSTLNTDRIFMDDIKFDDLSAFGAVGGVKETFIGQIPVRHWDGTKPVEMVQKQNILGLGESVSFEEHVL